MKLIDKDALVFELNRRMQEHHSGYLVCLKDILSFINTLEVKEVDIDKYYIDFLKREWFGKPGNRTISEMMAFTAKHFFELGLQARTDKELVEVKIGETKIYLEDDGGEQPYDSKQWLDLSCTEYEIPKTLFKDGDNVEIFIRKAQKGE